MDRPIDNAACDAAWVAAAQMHERVLASKGQLTSDLRMLGQKLLAARELTPHGMWLGKLNECGIHKRRAQRAMELAIGKASQKRQMGANQKRHVSLLEVGGEAKSGGAGGAPESDGFVCDMLDEDGVGLDGLDDGEEEDGDPVRPAVPVVVAGAVAPVARQLDFAEMYIRASQARDMLLSISEHDLRSSVKRWTEGLVERAGRGDSAAMQMLESMAAAAGVGRG